MCTCELPRDLFCLIALTHCCRKRLSQRKPALVLHVLLHATQDRFRQKQIAQEWGIAPGRATFVTPVRVSDWRAERAGLAAALPVVVAAAAAEVEDEYDAGGGGEFSPSPAHVRTLGSAQIQRARSELDALLAELVLLPGRAAVNALSRLTVAARNEVVVAQRIMGVGPRARGLFAPSDARQDDGLRRIRSRFELRGRRGVSAAHAFGKKGSPAKKGAAGSALPRPRGIVKPQPRKKAQRRSMHEAKPRTAAEEADRAAAIAALAATGQLREFVAAELEAREAKE